MFPCIVRPLHVSFLLAGACLAAAAVTPSRADEEPDPDVAHNTLHHTPRHASRIVLPVMPAAD